MCDVNDLRRRTVGFLVDGRPITNEEMWLLSQYINKCEFLNDLIGEEDMDINSCYPGAYLKAADLQGKTVKVTIDRVQVEVIGDEEKPVMYFVGKDRGLVLNKTNASAIATLYGSETDVWQGMELKLYPTKVNFQGGLVDAIRIRIEPPEAQEEDAIPF